MKLGPNGGLVFCIEYLSQNMEWLLEELSQFDEDGYFMFDCPGIDCMIQIMYLGQIELFTHFSFLGDITKELQDFGFHLVSVYLVINCYCCFMYRWIVHLLQMNQSIFPEH